MPRTPPPPHPKGAPRTTGSGRKRGTPNRKTIALRALMASLLEDVDYQHRLREDFRKRRVHPSIEALAWAYHLGKPKQQIEMSANVTMNERLAAEREQLRHLGLPELEKLLAESQALIDRALADAEAKRAGGATTAPVKPVDPKP